MRPSDSPQQCDTLNPILIAIFIAAISTATPIHWEQQHAAEIITAYEMWDSIPDHELLRTLQCESSLNPGAVNRGDSHGGSYGIAQINTGSHPDIAPTEMFDPVFSIAWAAKQFSEGHGSMWSCFSGADTS